MNHNQNELSCWENFADQSFAGAGGGDFFESALSSMVSSPAGSNSDADNNGGNIVVRELIGRLGGVICNNNTVNVKLNNLSTAAENDRHRLRGLHHHQANVNLQETYPIQSSAPPPSQFSADPEFAERAARFSFFANSQNLGGGGGGFLPPPSSSASSCSSSRVFSSTFHNQSPMMKNKEEQASDSDKKLIKTSESANNNTDFPDSRENSTVSNGQNDANKKRKSNARTKPAKDAPLSETSGTNTKRIKSSSEEENGNKSDKAKNSEPPKDYIHVRARRGQATDAHSLAERVRREKISERMKFLQDLVPGCNKITGKAVMLDEIINYVQSLQRQVEFLSMKLAAVNPRMDDFNVESIESKDILQQSIDYSFPPRNAYASDGYHPFEAARENLRRSSVNQFFDLGHYDETISQVSTAYMEDDLHSVVQMGFQKNQIPQFLDEGILTPTAVHMKVEQ